ncbi:MAG: MarR family transcriptional regulator [Christensenellaceae bacterium]|nr:MarR family transcriptional regulator [Christensenellaceae bacterium]
MRDQKENSLLLRNQLCFPLYAASREVIKQYRTHLDTLDLTYTQYIAMMAFWEDGKLSVKELGKKLFMDSGTLTPVLKSLEAKGFVRRYRSTEDERVLFVELTEKGKALREKAAEIPEKVSSCVDIDEEDGKELYRILYNILEKLTEEKN